MSRGDAARTVPWLQVGEWEGWSGVILVTTLWEQGGITGATWNLLLSHFNSSCSCSWTIVPPPAHNLSQLCRCLFPSANPAAVSLSATDCHPLCVICPLSFNSPSWQPDPTKMSLLKRRTKLVILLTTMVLTFFKTLERTSQNLTQCE